ncbi:hypothetical protein QE429_002949 [Bacillus sp. SORGH_AS 510]|uniref:hypothetical protein n=1 Tax=Bacillus sp. SORGH_AS_0510 TaxID=3041771 RepID=UPI00278B49EE|nr:hypothetical protein [Bacillus sp. SORGH_AS_0510]MDQ1146122.1 hypothetical protein [Bacillus sp. SORGH_AS_0510]
MQEGEVSVFGEIYHNHKQKGIKGVVMKLIECVTVKGVRYVGESGESMIIDFRECNQNWIQYRSRTEKLKNDEIQEIIRQDKTIGQRDSDSNPPYFEFFTRPFTRLEFESKGAFQQFRDTIAATGWSTIDLT